MIGFYKKTHNGRQGFTLIELAIVVVIIGLLVGGLLAANSMISTAKINAHIRKFQQLDIAINNFQENYKNLPGDSTLFTPPGDGSGVIGGSTACSTAPYNMYTRSEGINAWAQLKQAKMLEMDITPWSPTSCGGTHSTTSTNMGGISYPMFDRNRYWVTLRGNASDKVPIGWSTNFFSEIANNYNTFTNPFTVMAIDKKMDDGTLRHGTIVSQQYYSVDTGSTLIQPAYCDELMSSGGDDSKILCKFWYVPGRSQEFQ